MKNSTRSLTRVFASLLVVSLTLVFNKTYGQQIGLTGNSLSISDNDVTPSTTDFTDFASQTSRTFYLRNAQSSGNTTLTVSNITLSNTTDFTISTGLSDNTLAKNQTAVPFTISVTNTVVGTYTSTVTISSDATNDGTDNVWIYTISATVASPPVPQAKYTTYYENFDTNNGGWSSVVASNGSWLWTNTFPTSELGEGGFWRSSKYNNYFNNTNIVIQSPQLNFSGLNNLQLSLDVKYKTENNVDGMVIEYSVGGAAYVTLGSSTSNAINWYEDNASAIGSDAWNGDGHLANPSFNPHSQFVNARIALSDAIFSDKSNVRFRIKFMSDGAYTNSGVAFDNFRIDADPTSALNAASIAPADITNNLRLWLKSNEGISVADGNKLTNWEDQAYDTDLDKEDAYASAALAPTYRDNANRNMNFNPAVDFNHDNVEYMQGKGGYFAQDYFVVFRSDDEVKTQTGSYSPGRQFPIGGRYSDDSFHEDPTGLGMGSTSARFSNEILSHNISSFPNAWNSPPNDESWGRACTTTTSTYKNHPLLVNVKSNSGGTSTEIYKNGKRIDNSTGTSGNGSNLNFNEFENLQYLIGTGRSGIAGRTTSQMNGMVAEVISYSSANSAINQKKIQSYLAVKYGITLQNSSSTLTNHRLNDVEYIDSNGNVIWNPTETDNFGNYYNYDVAGIGRDDRSLLNQKQSRSQNDETETISIDGIPTVVPASGFLSMSLTDTYNTNNENIANNTNTFEDREFLMWGNNNANLDGTAINVTVDMSEDIIDGSHVTNVSFTGVPRVWRVKETGGDVSSVELSIPKTIVRTAAPPNGRYLMFISQNGDFGPTADYRVMNEIGNNLFVDYDFDGVEYITFGWAPEETFERSIYFNPSNQDYVDVENHLDINPSGFTISSWVMRGSGSNNKSILSKRPTSYTEGYDFKINNTGRFEVSWFNNSGSKQSLTSSVVIPVNKWHHLAVVYDGSKATIYIDGVADGSAVNRSAPVSAANNSNSFFIGAAGKNNPTAFFDGNIDEVRVWDTNLSEAQLRFIMNQEILANSDLTPKVIGKYFNSRSVTPTKNDIVDIPWAKLAGYYPMSTYTYTNTKDESGNGHQGALKNLKTVDLQTAPLPYVSNNNGDWDNNSTWKNGTFQNIPGTKSIVNSNVNVDWNIVKTDHNITIDSDSDLASTSNGNRSVLALFIDSNKLTVAGVNDSDNDPDTHLGTGFGLTVTHYLNLDGDIDLNGESQLIQTLNSDFDKTSTGKLDRDQQGTKDMFTYNYWSSPVGGYDSNNNNVEYKLPDVLRNGTNPNTPSAITFLTSGYDGAVSDSGISIADYWIWKFNNLPDDDYSSWQHVRSTGDLKAGEGYTMKGVLNTNGNVSQEQNYVFTGKPNNGVIELDLDAGNDYLLGNPYASAIDAQQFILDNGPQIDEISGVTTGSLYFWEHWGGGSHILAEYQGGYGTYNLSGATPAAYKADIDPDVDQGGSIIGTKTPGRYIPVGQGFFVVGEMPDGTVQFNNGQRVFKKEATGSSVFMGANNSTPFGSSTNGENNTQNNSVDDRMKIRLGFNSINTLHRQLLVTVDERATMDYDWGFDAITNEDQIDDMYWMMNDEKYVIQGIDVIDEMSTILPIGLHTDSDGINTITIDELENIAEDLQIFVHDKELNIYHDLRASDYEIFLNAGEYLERFEITFTNQDALSVTENTLETFHINYTNSIESIVVMNPKLVDVKAIELFSILGQSVYTNTNVKTASNIILEVKDLSSGAYIVKLKTDDSRTITQKVLIN